jgi:hypothetical protein
VKTLLKRVSGLAAITFAITTALGLTGVVAATDAQARPAPSPEYQWCPGQFWDPGWGNNWDGGNCHDDHHRDRDGNDHRNDWGFPGNRGPWQR